VVLAETVKAVKKSNEKARAFAEDRHAADMVMLLNSFSVHAEPSCPNDIEAETVILVAFPPRNEILG
jgi:hypothetical protein